MISKIVVNRSSLLHIALLYLKMKHVPVSAHQLHSLAPTKYKSFEDATFILEQLVQSSYAKKDNSNPPLYNITSFGIRLIPSIIAQQPRKGYEK
jgi:hypothetical protein